MENFEIGILLRYYCKHEFKAAEPGMKVYEVEGEVVGSIRIAQK